MPIPTMPTVQRSVGVSFKMFLVGFLVILCYVPSLMVYGLVAERQGRHEEAVQDISAKWGGSQLLSGPAISVPYTAKAPDANGVMLTQSYTAAVAPKDVSVKTSLQTEIRHRGIFPVPVYTAKVEVSGTLLAVDPLSIGGNVNLQAAAFELGVSDMHGLIEQPVLTYGGRDFPFEPGSQEYGATGIHVRLPSPPADGVPFHYTLTLRGTESLEFAPSAKSMTVAMTSPWTAPSFVGSELPSEYHITPEGFTSQWQVSPWYVSGAQPTLAYNTYTDSYVPQNSFGVKLVETTDFYTLVDRAIKYAILFIALTFLVLFLVEVLHTERVHPFQYILVGAALCMFYLLLLSFSEHIGFLPAYLLSAVATVLLVSWYSVSVLRHKKFGTSVGILLAVLYGYLYLLLQIEDYALLFGSVILFAILAAVMYVTRKVDWYGKDPS